MKHSSLFLLLGMIFFSACAGVDRGDFGPFERHLNTKAYGYQVKDDPRAQAVFQKVEVFEVRPGDCSGYAGGWSDCKNDNESSALQETHQKNNNKSYPGNEYWYGWSFYFPGSYPDISPTKTVLVEFRQRLHRDSYKVWKFDNPSSGYYLNRLVRNSTVARYKLIDEKDLRCRWHQIEVQARWAKDSTGFFRVWVNGVQKVNYQGKTIDRTDVRSVYLRYGIRRVLVSRYKNRFQKEVPTQRVYFANVKRGDSRSDLRAHPGL